MSLIAFYASCKDFKTYVDKYCTKHQISVAQALQHVLVTNYAEVCREREESK